MTNEEQILKGLREIYKQNQEILEFMHGALGTPTHVYPKVPTSKGKRPWEQGWSKDKNPEDFKL